jgi:hypothetical protein
VASLSHKILPPALHDWVVLTEIDDAALLAGPLFRRKYGDPPPDVAHHLVALALRADGGTTLLGYSHMRPFGDIYLSGGSCTDGDAIRALTNHERDAIKAAGGILHWILKYAFARYADRCDAFFGHCGDPRAMVVTRAAGFEPTAHQHLIAHWHKPLHENFRRALIAKAHALGPF